MSTAGEIGTAIIAVYKADPEYEFAEQDPVLWIEALPQPDQTGCNWRARLPDSTKLSEVLQRAVDRVRAERNLDQKFPGGSAWAEGTPVR